MTTSDHAQRCLALDISKSFIVQAPAGSGKTELLIQRYLSLLCHVDSPEEILAITFTKKAANEMRMRVIAALNHANTDPEPSAEHAKKTWAIAKKVLERNAYFTWNILKNPNQLRIQTIDSLCSFLTNQLPFLSKFGSPPQIADDPQSLYEEAVYEVLTHLEEDLPWSNALSQLLLHLDNDLNKLHDLLVQLLTKRDQWLPYIHLDVDNDVIKKQLEFHLQNIINHHLAYVIQLFPSHDLDELQKIAGFHQPLQEDDWQRFAELLLTQKNTWRSRPDQKITANNKARWKELVSALSEHEALRQALSGIFKLPPAYYPEKQWMILRALFPLLKVITAQLQISFQRHGRIDYIENAQAALFALGHEENPTDLALALDYQIRHILIDEFQDTSFSQYLLLEKLTAGWEQHDGRTLFIVGDPMQSIYRFRQAEVGLFIRMWESGIGHLALTPLRLTVNFRSTETIVNWNNHLFHSIFPAFSNMTNGAVSYSPSIAFMPNQTNTSKNKDNESEVVIKGFTNHLADEQANYIVKTIAHLLASYPTEKIAILVRSRSHLAKIIQQLKKENITYSAIDIDSLSSKQYIQDLLSLTCALLHAADRIAWLSILRAPWCGLSLADLLIIAGNTTHNMILSSLSSELIFKQLSIDGQIRLRRVLPILQTSIAERERTDLRSWIESTWLHLGGPACLANSLEIQDTQAYFDLLESIYANDRCLKIDKLKERINHLYSSTAAHDTRVQMMTIHSAKGLEFDTVILPHLERKLPYDEHTLFSWMEQLLPGHKKALLLAPIHATGDEKDRLYTYIRHQERIKSNYETDRLLYVAATRAKKRLYLCFNTSLKENGDYKIEHGSFLEKIWPPIQEQASSIITRDNTKKNHDELPTKINRYITRLPATWEVPISWQKNISSAYHQQTDGFQLNDQTSKYIGIVTHRVLQQLAEQGVAWWQKHSLLAQENYLKTHLQQLAITPHRLDDAIGYILKIIQNILNDKRGLWILTKHQEARCEFAITAYVDKKLQQLIIDRTFVDEQGYRWLIDYKTSEKVNQDEHIKQMQIYSKALRLMDHRPIRMGLYFVAIPQWIELQI